MVTWTEGVPVWLAEGRLAHRRRVAKITALTAAALAILSAGCTSRQATQSPACGLSRKLVPKCGVILGIATDPPTIDRLHQVESGFHVRFRMVHRFNDLDSPIPTADESALLAEGRILQISLDARFYSRPDDIVRWSEIAAGKYDVLLRAQARGVASLRKPVFLTFDHEPDLPRRVGLGTPSEFVAAWRHVHALFDSAGATNAVWVWVVTGSPDTAALAARMYPGNDVVDWISWESYNASGCREDRTDPARFRSFADTTLPFLRHLRAVHTQLGIDLNKPMMISEGGSVLYPDDPTLTASWYRQIPAVLAAHPQIKAIGLWDRTGTGSCDYRFDDTFRVASAVAHAGRATAIEG